MNKEKLQKIKFYSFSETYFYPQKMTQKIFDEITKDLPKDKVVITSLKRPENKELIDWKKWLAN